jgi:hypothetical protein
MRVKKVLDMGYSTAWRNSPREKLGREDSGQGNNIQSNPKVSLHL